MGSIAAQAGFRIEEKATDRPQRSSGWKTVLFNDAVHSFSEVAVQLTRAIRCTYEKGLQLANVVHHTGSATVFTGPRERCEAVAAVLEEIRLKTRVVND